MKIKKEGAFLKEILLRKHPLGTCRIIDGGDDRYDGHGCDTFAIVRQ